MAEEVHNPSYILPRAISYSVPIGTVSGVVFLLPILFTLPDINTLLQGVSAWYNSLFVPERTHECSVSSGQPMGVMFTLIMGSNAGGFGLVSAILTN